MSGTGVPTLSVAIVVLNEEERLRPCLESVVWADEIVVVDAGSSDKTMAVAREFTDRAMFRAWDGYGAQKNFALGHCRGDWLLSIDAEQQIFLGEDPVPFDRLEDVLRHNVRLQEEHELFVQADENVPYGAVVRVLAVVRRAGVESLGLVTNPLGSGNVPVPSALVQAGPASPPPAIVRPLTAPPRFTATIATSLPDPPASVQA